ncbi:hypothetical protein COU54_01620 [Candidatus Pacearchaeota archaeon CG10_big_fil_rev_8_21_14_0_10_31_24]|nr:MAG: hypothetical protein COU54_01620 [Candidatus Pacearchaeota archaeon CG10_big_fil_rev_8_21_14_0_10_31_24]
MKRAEFILIFILIVSVMALFFFQGNLTGQVIGSGSGFDVFGSGVGGSSILPPDSSNSVSELYCNEIDEVGRDYYTKGRVDVSGNIAEDFCNIEGNKLTEYYCVGKTPFIEVVECNCLDGACELKKVNHNSCYLQFEIQESESFGKTVFSLLDVKSVYGEFDSNRLFYEAEDAEFVLNTYGTYGNLLNRYALDSSRTIIAEIFPDSLESEPESEIIQLDSGKILSTIPYDGDIAQVSVENLDRNDFSVLDIDFSTLSCEVSCKNEGEFVKEGDSCCAGLSEIDLGGSDYVCSNCGDGICSQYEDKNICKIDCN